MFLCIGNNISCVNPTRRCVIASWVDDILASTCWNSFLSVAYQFVTHFLIVCSMDIAYCFTRSLIISVRHTAIIERVDMSSFILNGLIIIFMLVFILLNNHRIVDLGP